MLRPIDSKNILPMLLTFILAILVVNNVRSLFNYRKGINKLAEAQKELRELQDQNQKLKGDIQKAQSDEFIEKSALENLNLTKDPQTILIMGKTETFKQKNAVNTAQSENGQPKASGNLQLWLKAFHLD